MAGDKSSARNIGGLSTLSLPSPADAVREGAVNSVLTVTVDGGASTTTAANLPRNGNARSRSRSPHPVSSVGLSHNPEETVYEHGLSSGFNPDTENTSVDLHSFLESSSNGSDTDLSMTALDPLAGKHHVSPPQSAYLVFRSRVAAKLESIMGLLMVILAMLFGALMGATARLMQTGPAPMHTFQILFARQSVTVALSMAYMYWRRIPEAPLGPRGVRKLLVARAFGGFFGVWGLFYSVRYLPLGEAIVITFLAPMVTNWVCSVLLKEPFTRREQLAAVISMIGVIFITKPTSFFDSSDSSSGAQTPAVSNLTVVGTDAAVSVVPAVPESTPIERLVAILVALIGVCGAACAYTTIRWIGKRAHPLISVNYFSVWCTIVSLVALLVVPDVTFRFPVNVREWLLLLSLGTFGMALQFLLTAGLAREKGSTAMNMAYTQMIFVLIIDYVLWGTVLTWSSWVGCFLILGSQIWGAMARGEALKEMQLGNQSPDLRSTDEEVGLVADMDGTGNEDHESSGTEFEMQHANYENKERGS